MITTMTIMILKLIFVLDLGLGVIDISNTRHVKNNKQRINACSMAFKKKLVAVHVKDI